MIWGILIEIGMMTTAPMVIAMDTGYFGTKYRHGYEVLTASGLAHLTYGLAMGILVELHVHRAGLVPSLVMHFRKKLARAVGPG